MPQKKLNMSRRTFFINTGKATAAAAAVGNFVTNEDYEAIAQNVKTSSQPSDLKITDLRVCRVDRRWVVKIDTNQGIYGLGEVRDGSSPTYALMLKSRIMGMNPCNVDQIFRKIKQFGFHARQSGGPVSIEEACWDLAGKAWGVPCWQMLGGKFRDRILCYADTPSTRDPEAMGKRLKARMNDWGFKFLKMDFGIRLCQGIEGCITRPPAERTGTNFPEHNFSGITITDKGLDVIAQYIATVREIIGWEIPLATDHYGHLNVESCIKLAQKVDQFNLAWLEDMVPWWYTEHLKRIKESCRTPLMTGEDIYCKEEFIKLFKAQAISICHPDAGTSGGLLETKKIGDIAQEYGIPMAIHMAGSPVAMQSMVHTAAATENFLVMENHSVDDDTYNHWVTGLPDPIIQDGHCVVTDAPGLGIDLNMDYIKSQTKDPSTIFPPTDEWNNERSNDRLYSLYTGKVKKVHS